MVMETNKVNTKKKILWSFIDFSQTNFLRKCIVLSLESLYADIGAWSHIYTDLILIFFFSSQIETIDDPVPAVEAILRRCNKHQVLKITLVYNEGHVRVLCTSNFGSGGTNKVSFTSFPCKGRIVHVNFKKTCQVFHFKYANKENLNTWKIILVMYATLKRKP